MSKIEISQATKQKLKDLMARQTVPIDSQGGSSFRTTSPAAQVKITSDEGSGYYLGVPVLYDGTDWVEFDEVSVMEANLTEDLLEPDKIYNADLGPDYVFIVDGGRGLTLEGSTLTPSYPGINKIYIQQSGGTSGAFIGLTLSQPSAGTAMISVNGGYQIKDTNLITSFNYYRDLILDSTNGLYIASGTVGADFTIAMKACDYSAPTPGVMTNATQQIGGNKYWYGNYHEFSGNDMVRFLGPELQFQHWHTGPGNNRITFNVNNGSGAPCFETSAGVGITNEFYDAAAIYPETGGGRSYPGLPVLTYAADFNGTHWRWNLGWGNSEKHYPAIGTRSHGLAIECGWSHTAYTGDKAIISGYQPCFSVFDSPTATQYDGATATTGGLTFKGGLYISGTLTGLTSGDIGVTVQAWSAALDTLAANITAFGQSLVASADASAARTVLGLGTLATQSGTFSGTSSGVNTGDQTITLTGDVTGSGTGSFTTAIGTGVIVDADVNASAAIAWSKLDKTGSSLADLATRSASDLSSGLVGTARLGSGTANSSTYLRGDQTWASTALDINGLSALSPVAADEVPYYSISATANKKTTAQKLLGLSRLSPGGRLVADSSLGPVTATDVTGATSLWYIPYIHDQMVLWDGSDWMPYTIPSLSGSGWPLALASGSAWNTANKPHDVFAYVSSGAIALEYLVWSTTTARATSLTVTDGRLTKTGDKTRLYLGSFCATSSTQTDDSKAKRLIWNYYNQVPRPLRYVDSTSSWTYSTNAWRRARAQSAAKVEVCVGIDFGMVDLRLDANLSTTTTVGNWASIGVDTTTGAYPTAEIDAFSGVKVAGSCVYRDMPGLGYHEFNWLEWGGTSGTTTWYGAASGTYESGLKGVFSC